MLAGKSWFLSNVRSRDWDGTVRISAPLKCWVHMAHGLQCCTVSDICSRHSHTMAVHNNSFANQGKSKWLLLSIGASVGAQGFLQLNRGFPPFSRKPSSCPTHPVSIQVWSTHYQCIFIVSIHFHHIIHISDILGSLLTILTCSDLACVSFVFLSFSFHHIWHDICTYSGLIEWWIPVLHVGYRSGLVGLDNHILFDVGVCSSPLFHVYSYCRDAVP